MELLLRRSAAVGLRQRSDRARLHRRFTAPRLAVGVYATSASTPLYFAQAIGRFVRARRPGERASVFLPSVRPLLTLAAEMEKERDHALDRFRADDDIFGAEDDLLRQANREQDNADELGSFEALSATGHLASVVLNSTEVRR